MKYRCSSMYPLLSAFGCSGIKIIMYPSPLALIRPPFHIGLSEPTRFALAKLSFRLCSSVGLYPFLGILVLTHCKQIVKLHKHILFPIFFDFLIAPFFEKDNLVLKGFMIFCCSWKINQFHFLKRWQSHGNHSPFHRLILCAFWKKYARRSLFFFFNWFYKHIASQWP